MLAYLVKRSFYFTNLVKWTGHDATLPDKKKIELYLPLLEKEIELVRPKYIVTFGLMPFTSLVKEKIKLSEYYDEVMSSELRFYRYESVPVIPCYFPVGRGNPKRAVEMLRKINELK